MLLGLGWVGGWVGYCAMYSSVPGHFHRHDCDIAVFGIGIGIGIGIGLVLWL